jgi:hypothetical protein
MAFDVSRFPQRSGAQILPQRRDVDIGHLTRIKMGHLSSAEIPQVPDAPREFPYYHNSGY